MLFPVNTCMSLTLRLPVFCQFSPHGSLIKPYEETYWIEVKKPFWRRSFNLQVFMIFDDNDLGTVLGVCTILIIVVIMYFL